MGMNSQIHIVVESEIKSDLRSKARSKGLSLGEYCRLKLLDNEQLNRIEDLLIGLKNN